MFLLRMAIAAGAIASTALVAVPTSAAPKDARSYIVQLTAAPAVAYEGGVSGLGRTAVEPGKRIDPRNADVQKYVAHLKKLNDGILKKVPGAKKLHDYAYAFPGFAAKMSPAQAKAVAKLPVVVRISEATKVHADTVSTPDYLGLRGAGGVWQQQFGSADNAGLGVIVGIIDTGIWPENPSFAAMSSPRPDQATIDAKWYGECEADSDVTCNNKIIGARWFRGDTSGLPAEELSARDVQSHGTHVAATAAGNRGVAMTNLGQNLGTASGMAPAARLAIYKALFSGGSGTNDDIVAAVDAAVADGVDVLNMSLGGPETEVTSPIGVATYFAATAGVYVAMTAGNDGPTTGTVGNAKPWVTTVAAGTHDRFDQATLTLGNGQKIVGAGVSPALASAPIRWADQVGGADRTCAPGSLGAAAAGKIVICNKADGPLQAAEVKRAGGFGIVLKDFITPSAPTTVIGLIPAITIRNADFGPVTSYIDSTANAVASFGAWSRSTITAPKVADYSSTGPDPLSKGNLLKPDILAPGSDIYASASPDGTGGPGGPDYTALSGTSMASPHIAGIAALLLSKHPTWTPPMVHSALMTTAIQTDSSGAQIKRDNGDTANPFHKGAGFVRPGSAFNPGLVYIPAANGWKNFVCALGEPAPDGTACPANPGSASNLNYPSIASGAVSGSQTFTRRVKNISGVVAVYTANVQAPPGFTATVSPSLSVSLGVGAEFTFTVKLTRTSAPLGSYRFGSITWTDLFGHSVRSPIAVRPI